MSFVMIILSGIKKKKNKTLKPQKPSQPKVLQNKFLLSEIAASGKKRVKKISAAGY